MNAAHPTQAASLDKSKKAIGHYEIIGETYAKFEFYENGWYPYSRFLDVDKIDFVLRKRDSSTPTYREIQVKYGKLYDCGSQWEREHFDVTSWRFFKKDEFASHIHRSDFFIAYVLARDLGYERDIFIFPVAKFQELIGKAIPSGDRVKMYISRLKDNSEKWVMRTDSKSFHNLDKTNSIDVSAFRRNFNVLSQES